MYVGSLPDLQSWGARGSSGAGSHIAISARKHCLTFLHAAQTQEPPSKPGYRLFIGRSSSEQDLLSKSVLSVNTRGTALPETSTFSRVVSFSSSNRNPAGDGSREDK